MTIPDLPTPDLDPILDPILGGSEPEDPPPPPPKKVPGEHRMATPRPLPPGPEPHELNPAFY